MHSAWMPVTLTISVSQLNYVKMFNQMRRDANFAKMEKNYTTVSNWNEFQVKWSDDLWNWLLTRLFVLRNLTLPPFHFPNSQT